MRKIWTFLFIVFCSMNIVMDVHATDLEQVTMDVSDYLIQEGGRPDVAFTEVETLLDRVPEKRVAVFSVQRSATELTLEDYLVQELKQFSQEINISSYNISTADVGNIYYTILNRHPELFYVTGGMSYSFYGNIVYSVRPQYDACTQEEIDAIYAAMDKPLQMLSNDMTIVEKILFLHDYLCINVAYSENDLNSHRYHCIEGVALEGMAVCEGYAEAFQYFMNELDIPCNIVTNDNHAWNQVEIDGEWYMLDATHDDPVSDLYGRACHTYFLKSAGLMSNRTWVEEDFEICDSTRFDNAFWTKTDTQTIYHNGNWYYLNAGEKKLYCHEYGIDSIEDPGEIVMNLDYTWNVMGSNSFWVGSFSKLAKVEDKLIYSSPSNIFICDFDGNNVEILETADTSGGYIYGMKLKNSQIIYQLAKSPNDSISAEVVSELKGIKDISTADIQLSNDLFYYEVQKHYPEITVRLNGTELEKDKHYTISYNYPASGVGEVTILITGTGYYKGTARATYTIKKGTQQIVCPQVSFEKGYGCDVFSLNATVEGGVLEYQTSDAEVAVVDTKGNVEIKGMGTAVITITAPASECFEEDTETVEIVVLSCSHTDVSDKIQKQASCTEDGKQATVCNDCHKVISEKALPMQEHSWDEGKITKEATAVEAGEKTYTCDECGKTKIETIPAKGVPKKNTTLKDEDGTASYVVTKTGKTGGTVTYKKNLKTSKTQVKIPSKVTIDGITYKVTAIANGAFKNNKIKKVTIPSTVTTIGNEAFSGCKKLTSVTIPSNVKKIGKKAFYKCSKLKSISIKSSKLTKTSIGSNAFKGIYKKAVIKVPKKKLSTYKKWIKKAGAGSKVTIKKQ